MPRDHSGALGSGAAAPGLSAALVGRSLLGHVAVVLACGGGLQLWLARHRLTRDLAMTDDEVRQEARAQGGGARRSHEAPAPWSLLITSDQGAVAVAPAGVSRWAVAARGHGPARARLLADAVRLGVPVVADTSLVQQLAASDPAVSAHTRTRIAAHLAARAARR